MTSVLIGIASLWLGIGAVVAFFMSAATWHNSPSKKDILIGCILFTFLWPYILLSPKE